MRRLYGAPYAPFPTSAGFQTFDHTFFWMIFAHTPYLTFYHPVACAQPVFEARGLQYAGIPPAITLGPGRGAASQAAASRLLGTLVLLSATKRRDESRRGSLRGCATEESGDSVNSNCLQAGPGSPCKSASMARRATPRWLTENFSRAPASPNVQSKGG